MDTAKILSKINKILDYLKIGVVLNGDGKDTVEYIPIKNNKHNYEQYNANILLEITYEMFLTTSKRDIEIYIIKQLVHEIGHLLVVPPHRRRQKDYGIKPKSLSLSVKTNDKYELEEMKANAIGHEIYDRIGFKTLNKDYRDSIYVKEWWQSQGKTLVDNMFYILGI